jgi:hypothetical protein
MPGRLKASLFIIQYPAIPCFVFEEHPQPSFLVPFLSAIFCLVSWFCKEPELWQNVATPHYLPLPC